eukprot:scaffold9115_cov115-Isochrysis_galbana.AAC.6
MYSSTLIALKVALNIYVLPIPEAKPFLPKYAENKQRRPAAATWPGQRLRPAHMPMPPPKAAHRTAPHAHGPRHNCNCNCTTILPHTGNESWLVEARDTERRLLSRARESPQDGNDRPCRPGPMPMVIWLVAAGDRDEN